MAVFDYYPWLFPLFATLFGLLVGSFLNVVIYRLPIMMEKEWKKDCIDCFPDLAPKKTSEEKEETFNLSVPRSCCPKCQTQIKFYDNIPVISWLLLKGKCRQCSNPISFRYPAIELLSGAMCFAVSYLLPFSYFAIAAVLFTLVLIALTFIDIDTMLLPDQITLPLLWSGLYLALVGWSSVSLVDSVVGAMAGYLILWSIYWGFKLLTGKEGMGYGDFKLLAALGAWLGWQQLPLIILLSSVVGAIIGVIMLTAQKKGFDKAIPFGPYLAIAGWVCLLWGQNISQWYFNHILGLPL
ncbi:prepilin peptidase [Aliivibrio fischeri]|uniref:prepilin peptidase n=1 Tax=Aliivibrio fischeri TaxID=668 RepID=UPI00105BBCEB|nr:A24 family peptidase [Aliivibrio fischeri]TDM55235.1 prepilin peptidase [Aliivibrio fischeri]